MYKPKPKPQNTKSICPCGCGKELMDHELFQGGCITWQRVTALARAMGCPCKQRCDQRPDCPIEKMPESVSKIK